MEKNNKKINVEQKQEKANGKDFGDKLKIQRTEMNLSRDQMAEKIGVSLYQYGRWERSEYLPSAKYIDGLIEVLGDKKFKEIFDIKTADADKDTTFSRESFKKVFFLFLEKNKNEIADIIFDALQSMYIKR